MELSRGIVLAFIAGASLIAAPTQAEETVARTRQQLEQEIVDRLAHGREVESLLKSIPPQSTRSTRPLQNQEARDLDARLNNFRLQLRAVVQKGRLTADLSVPLLNSYEAVKAAHMLYKERFQVVQERLTRAGSDSLFEQRRQAAEQTYSSAMADILGLETLLQGLQDASQRQQRLNDPVFQQQALAAFRKARDSLDAKIKIKAPPALRANVLPFRQASLAQRAPKLTPIIKPSYRIASESTVAPAPADLADTVDAPLSPEILRQAKALDYDYIRIYEFVRNTIKTEWYAGGMKGAVGTLRQQSGNDVDQASLLIALFRASGLASRYVFGVIELPIEDVMNSLGLSDANQAGKALTRAGVGYKPIIRGGRVAAVQVEHTWVAAHVPYTNYRGAMVDASGKTWLPLAPSLKRYQETAPTGILGKANISLPDLMDAYLLLPQITDPLSGLRKQITEYLQANLPDQTYAQQLYSRTVIPANIGLIPNTLPVPVAAVTEESATLSDAHRQRIRIVARQGVGAADAILLDATFPAAELASERVTLSYIPATVDDHKVVNMFGGLDAVPAYLIKLRPQIKINGRQRVVAQGMLDAGLEHRLEIYMLGAGAAAEQIDQTVIAGSYHAIGVVAQQVAVAADPTQPIDPRAADDPADTEYQAAKILGWRALRYIDQWNQAEQELAALLGVAVVHPLPTLTVASNAMRVDTVLGRPQQMHWQGVTLDAALRISEPLPMAADGAVTKDWMRMAALQGSALEHLLFERDFLVDSISADKGLGLARESGIPVLTIDAGNISTALPTLTHPDSIKSDIQNWVRLGMRVETPRDPIVHQAWQGSVWRVEDPGTGAGGYFIAGALAGGATAVDPTNWVLQWLADALSLPNSAPYNDDASAGFEIVKMAAADGQTGDVGKPLPSPLAVMVRDEAGLPVKGADVLFSVTAGGGKFSVVVDPAAGAVETEGAVVARTNALGIAQVTFILGKKTADNPIYVKRDPKDKNVTRAGLNLVDASVGSRNGTLVIAAPFQEVAYPKEAEKLRRTNPQSSITSPGIWVDTIIVAAEDEFQNPVSNVDLTFAVGAATPAGCGAVVQPVVFDATEMGTGKACPSHPVLGDCGTPTRTEKTSVQGAATGVIAGLGLANFSIVVSASALPSSSHTFKLDEACSTRTEVHFESSTIINEEGRNIAAAKIGTALKRQVGVTVLVGSRKGGWKRAAADQASFEVGNGGSSSGATFDGVGTYSTTITTGASPGANNIRFIAVNAGGIRNDNGSNRTFSFPLFDVFGVDPKITKLVSQGTEPDVLYLGEDGHSLFSAEVQYAVLPANYTSSATEVDFLKDGAWDDYAIGTTRFDTGKAPVPRGARFEVGKTYETQLVLNRGSEAEIKSDKFKLQLRQKIFKNVTRAFHVSQDVDFVNQRVCTQGTGFRFTLMHSATITLTFTDIVNTASKKVLINGKTMAKGDQSVPILPSDLSPGRYTFELQGVSTIDGHQELEQGSASVQFQAHNRLPVGHTLVKGVDVHDGHLVLGAEDFTVPGRGAVLEFRRNYASNGGTEAGPLGVGWTHNYLSKIIVNPCGEVIVIGGEGSGMRFIDDGTGGLKPLKGYHGTLIANQADRTFDFYSKDGTRHHYRLIAQGKEWHLEFIEDVNGNVTRLGYDPTSTKAKLITVEDPAGRSLNFTYEDRAFILGGLPDFTPSVVITKVKGPDGMAMTFKYDANGNLIEAARENNSRVESYVYTPSSVFMLDGKLTGHRNPNGATTTYAYNAEMLSVPLPGGGGVFLSAPNSFVTQITDAETGVTRFVYDFPAHRTTVTDPRGNATTYTMNEYGSPLSIQDPAGTTSMTWAVDDIFMTSKTDARGTRTDYTYDKDGNLLTEKVGTFTTAYTYQTFASRPIKNRVKTLTDRNGNTTTNTYDGRGNLTIVKNAEGGLLRHTYATNGDRVQTQDPNGNVTRFSYDIYGNVEAVTDALGKIARMRFNARSLPVGATDALGRVTTLEYDTLSRLIKKTNADGGIRGLTYDAVGNRLTETDEENRTVTWTYDKENRVKSIKNPLNQTKTVSYDLAGNKINESDWQSNLTTFEYDAANRLIKRTEPLNKIAQFSYDAVGNVLTETDALNRITRHDYDALNRRTKTTDALGGMAEYTYDGVGNKTSVKDALLRLTAFAYDKLNRLTVKTEPLGRITRYAYDANGNRITETDANGNIRRMAYDALNRPAKKTDALKNSTLFEYDAVGNLVTEINPRLAQTRHEYDRLNRRVKTTDPVPAVTTFSYDKVGNKTGEVWANQNALSHTYDALNRPIATQDSLGPVTAYAYDANGNRTHETDANGNTTSKTYDALNRLIQVDQPELRRLQFEYDLVGNKVKEIDGNAHITAFLYDVLNRLTTVTDPFAKTVTYTYDAVGNRKTETDKRGNLTQFDYDDLNRLIQGTDALTQVTTFAYDAVGNKTSETDKRGTRTDFTYDKENRLISTVKATVTLSESEYDEVGNREFLRDANGNLIAYKYDLANRLILESKLLAAITSYKYNPIGDRIETRDPEGRITTAAYDARRRMLTETNALAETVTYTYDANGNRTSSKRPKGTTYSYAFDGLNRLIQITDALSGVTGYTYDKNNNRLTQRDANGNITHYEYDALNRQTAMIYPDTARVEFRYDEMGNRIGLTDAGGQVFSYLFDALNRETEKNYPLPVTPTGDDLQKIATVYDANSNPTSITETFSGVTGNRITGKTYDLFDRLLSVRDGFGKTLRYAYDANGNRTTITDPDGNVTRYTYDALNRVASVGNNGGVTNYEYDRSSLRTRIAYPNGSRAITTYDGARRTLRIDNTQNAALLSRYEYTYDANGNRTQQIETNGGSPETTTYGFDDNDWLIEARYPSKTSIITYDGNGNRLSEKTVVDTTTESNKTHTYNNRNQLTQITDSVSSANNVAYTYDQNGNQTVKTKNGVTTTFVYDVRDQLISVQENTTTLGQFFYDYAGMRIAKSGADGFIKYVYDGKSVLVQTNSQGVTLAKYEYGPDRLLSINHATEGRQFYLFDALRSTVNLTKSDGSVNARYQYDAWGHLLNNVSSWNKFTYTGHEQDKETGLYYFKARFYDPDTGRFLTEDPYLGDINTPPSLHRYLYAYANPVVYVDLTGYVAWATDGMEQFDKWNQRSEESLAALPEGAAGYVGAAAVGVGMGANRVGKGILSGINYVANWGSVLFRTENAQSHAMEIAATHESVVSGVKSFADRDTRAAIGERVVENLQAVASGDPKAIAGLASASTELGLGAISPKGVPPVGARVAAGIQEVKTLATEVKAVITGESATGGLRQAVKEVTQSVKAEVSLGERVAGSPATQTARVLAKEVEPPAILREVAASEAGPKRPGGYKTHDVDTHGNLSPKENRAPGHLNTAADNMVQSHHPIQDAWAKRNVPGYSKIDAPTVLLETSSGKAHAQISASQKALRAKLKAQGRDPFSTTIREEFNQGYRQMIDAGVPEDIARKVIKDNYKYFDELGGFKK